jgi:hypothetical protein
MEVQQKIKPGAYPDAQGVVRGKIERPAPTTNRQEQQVAPLSSENASLKEDKPAQVSVVNAQPQGELPKMMKAGFDAVLGKLNKSTEPEYIQVRNDEQSVSTYVASIFDHPVVHPGIYKM